MNITIMSDLHSDNRYNYELLINIIKAIDKKDIIIVAGDISSNINIVKKTLSMLKNNFHHVLFTPGNHELWQTETGSSWDKLENILEVCHSIGVETGPIVIDDVLFMPLFSWYTDEWAYEDEKNDSKLEGWVDYYLCKWNTTNVHKTMYEINMHNIQKLKALNYISTLSYSHFLPRRDLLPIKKLTFKGLPSVAGCHEIEKQIRELESDIHIFGHSHIPYDNEILGIRYINAPLGNYEELLFNHPKTLTTEEIKAHIYSRTYKKNVA